MRNYLKLLFWLNLWAITWVIITPFRRGRHNCMSWSLEKWANHGGYLVIRWAQNAKYPWFTWPHFLWQSEENCKTLVSVQGPSKKKRTLPLLWFEPRVEYGDPKMKGEE